jgi:hypothetical protein
MLSSLSLFCKGKRVYMIIISHLSSSFKSEREEWNQWEGKQVETE